MRQTAQCPTHNKPLTETSNVRAELGLSYLLLYSQGLGQVHGLKDNELMKERVIE